MQNEMVFVGAPNDGTLMLPAEARNRVSRQEFVNLMVMDYVERTEQEIKVLDAAHTAAQDVVTKAIEAAYVAWAGEITNKTRLRLLPWYEAVRALLDPEVKLSDVGSENIPREVTYTFTSVNTEYSGREVLKLSEILNGWINQAVFHGAASVDLDAETLKVQNKVIALERWLMAWSFAPAVGSYGDDYHRIKIVVDARPGPEVRAAILRACEAEHDFQEQHRVISRLREEIDDKNVVKLERRALAELTRAAIEKPDELPKLGGRS
jgi:hypothetical protein